MIDLNATFFVQFVNFFLILILLNVVLIGPIRRILKKRADFVSSQMHSIEQFTTSAATKLADYEKALAEARQQAVAARIALKEEAQAPGPAGRRCRSGGRDRALSGLPCPFAPGY